MKIPVKCIIEIGLLRKQNKCALCKKEMDIKKPNVQLCKSCREKTCKKMFGGVSKMKTNKDIKKEILKFHNLVVKGLVNGLSHTEQDGRTEELEFWRQRSILFDRFGHCVMNLITDQSYDIDLHELNEVAKNGYKNN